MILPILRSAIRHAEYVDQLIADHGAAATLRHVRESIADQCPDALSDVESLVESLGSDATLTDAFRRAMSILQVAADSC